MSLLDNLRKPALSVFHAQPWERMSDNPLIYYNEEQYPQLLKQMFKTSSDPDENKYNIQNLVNEEGFQRTVCIISAKVFGRQFVKTYSDIGHMQKQFEFSREIPLIMLTDSCRGQNQAINIAKLVFTQALQNTTAMQIAYQTLMPLYVKILALRGKMSEVKQAEGKFIFSNNDEATHYFNIGKQYNKNGFSYQGPNPKGYAWQPTRSFHDVFDSFGAFMVGAFVALDYQLGIEPNPVSILETFYPCQTFAKATSRGVDGFLSYLGALPGYRLAHQINHLKHSKLGNDKNNRILNMLIISIVKQMFEIPENVPINFKQIQDMQHILNEFQVKLANKAPFQFASVSQVTDLLNGDINETNINQLLKFCFNYVATTMEPKEPVSSVESEENVSGLSEIDDSQMSSDENESQESEISIKKNKQLKRQRKHSDNDYRESPQKRQKTGENYESNREKQPSGPVPKLAFNLSTLKTTDGQKGPDSGQVNPPTAAENKKPAAKKPTKPADKKPRGKGKKVQGDEPAGDAGGVLEGSKDVGNEKPDN